MQLPTLAQIQPYIDGGLIRATTSQRFSDLTVYNYTQRCTYSGEWDKVTRQCRGLILDSAGRCVARPWPKFFNVGEKHAEEPPQRLPDSVTVKEDGSLGIGFVYQGRVVWSTRGTLDSEQAAVAQRIWDERYQHVDVSCLEGYTLLAEIVGPETKIIIDYPEPALIALGLIWNDDGVESPRADLEALTSLIGMPIVQEEPFTLEQLAAMKSTMDATQEGYVVRWGSLRLKVKGDAYCRIARVLSGFTERRIGDLWYHQTPLPDGLPEESEEWARGLLVELDVDQSVINAHGATLALTCPHRSDIAEFARANREHEAFPIAISILRGKEYDTRKLVYRRRFGKSPRPI